MRTIVSAFSGRRIAVLLGLTAAAVLGGGVSSASAALFPQCPPVGVNDGCAVLITVDAAGHGTVADDPNPPNNGPYDGADDTLIGLQNNSPGSVNSVDLSSTTLPIFGFEGDGLCTVTPQPPGCPGPQGFGATGYEGPNNTFSNISSDQMSGTVNFTSPIPPGGSAYWGLEDTITAADINLGQIAVQGLACGSIDVSAAGYKPNKSLRPTIPGVRAYVKVSTPSTVVVNATLSFKGAAAAKSVNLGSFTLVDNGSKKLRIPVPKSLRLKVGDRVTLNLAIKSTPLSAPNCQDAATKNVSLKTRVVHILKSQHN